MKRARLIAFAVLTLVFLAACGGSQEQSVRDDVAQASTAIEIHVEEGEHAEDETIAEGLAIFREIGCAGCHGQDGEGGTGPAIAGHTAEQVQRQARTPKGEVMPAFSQEQLSDDQLDLIIAWVESLGPPSVAHDHAEEGGGDHAEEGGGEHAEVDEFDELASLAAHLRLALFAVKDHNAHDAEHHLEDLVGLLEDEHAKGQAEEILDNIQSGADLHDVEHEMEHLMGEIDGEAGQVVGSGFHLQLVLDSLTLDDLETAYHHLEHYAELVDDADLAEEATELQTYLAEGELHAVEDAVIALLRGEEPDHGD